ncbi:DMT family transporter [Rhodovulum kholense]|uniref:Threonine/homoserine efflux transporter RhtA n=1 Tax=Rhodovulum kholense TaxID=453584 RepID=A0A8E2VIH3_9RHOB|nr:DMT family transporter [Rhodovulum kholense]PTW47736.1 threonine/homoserine efflux transporter RhtA [Rhodovulum kholense]
MTTIADPAERLTMGRAEWAMLLALSVLWGGSFLFVGIAVAELPTLTLVWLRVALAALVLWAAVAVTGRPLPRSPGVWAAFLGMGLLNNVIPFSLIVAGQHSIASGLASILNATTPLFTVVVAGLLLADERPGGLKLCGVAAGLAGVAVMIGPDALAGLGTNALAQLAVLGGALSYACAAVFGRRFRRMGVDPLVTAAGQVGAATLLLSPAMLIADRPWTLPMPGTATCAAVLGLAVLSTALAYLLYFRILARAGATSLSLVTFLIPVSAILLGGLVLGERLAPTDFAGMACIALGLAAVDGRLFRR